VAKARLASVGNTANLKENEIGNYQPKAIYA
jgi:hypothetical protein